MKTDNLILIIIAISFLGFIVGLVGKNTGNARKKTLKKEEFYKYLMAISVIVMLVLAFIYNFLSF